MPEVWQRPAHSRPARRHHRHLPGLQRHVARRGRARHPPASGAEGSLSPRDVGLPVIVRRAEDLSIEEVVARREMIVAVADGEITAAALLADYVIAGAEAHLDWSSAQTLGALVWRIGPAALRLYALGGTDGIADADSVEWSGRSGLALDAAAALIRRRGGDTLERAEFARLFATGEPQKGLTAWLESRSTRRQA